MYKNAVVAGKFYPLHLGHVALIQKATEVAEHVDVLLVANENETISPYVRALAIYETFSAENIRVKIVDDMYTDDTTEISHVYWADMAVAALGYTPDVVVASEDYGLGWAMAMGCEFIMFDQERVEFPVSGTMCRENAFYTHSFMPAATKRYMIPRVVVVGAESTGTTTLANALGEHYNTVVVPEVGRLIEEESRRNGGGGSGEWDDGRFWFTSRAQDALEERMSEDANGVLICDTDSLATATFYLLYMKLGGTVSGTANGPLLDAGLCQAKKHCLYILTGDEIPFQQDEYGSRESENLRHWHTEVFRNYLSLQGITFVEVTGSHEERLAAAVEAVDKAVDRQRVPVLQ